METSFTRGDCEAIVRRLWPHLDGVLSEIERQLVTRHLEECDACRSHFEFASAFLDAVHEAKPDADEFSTVRHRIIAALTAEGFTGGS